MTLSGKLGRCAVGALGGSMILIALGTNDKAMAQYTQSGETLFNQRCGSCHVISRDQKAGIGPNLHGVVGRIAGSGPFSYSSALRDSKLTWTRANLDRYLAAPMQAVPGTRMAVSVREPAQRATIIRYLAAAK